MKTPIVKNQHYVPQFILRNFASGKKENLHVYDKLGRKSFISKSKNIASETYFYNFEVNEATFSYEQAFSVLEGTWASIIKKVIQDESISNLSAQELYDLAHFAAVQFARTRKMRNIILEMEATIISHVEKMGHTKEDIKDYIFSGNQLAPTKELQIMMDSIPEITRIMSLKHLTLARAPRRSPLMISDHPVVMDNNLQKNSSYGNLGLGVTGVEIYLPIHPEFALWFICPVWAQTIKESHQYVMDIFHVAPESLKNIKTKSIMEMHETIFSKKLCILNHENVVRLNSIQAKQSTRFIFSYTEDFTLLKKMQDAGQINETGRTLAR